MKEKKSLLFKTSYNTWSEGLKKVHFNNGKYKDLERFNWFRYNALHRNKNKLKLLLLNLICSQKCSLSIKMRVRTISVELF
jgi:hypothetical protein